MAGIRWVFMTLSRISMIQSIAEQFDIFIFPMHFQNEMGMYFCLIFWQIGKAETLFMMNKTK